MSGIDSERETRIRDYLDGRLSDDELETFELALFRDPVLLDDVEATRALRRGLREIAAQPVIGQVVGQAAPKSAPWPRALPFAAMFLLGAALPGALLWQRAMSLDGGKVQYVAVDRIRSAPQTPVVQTHTLDADADRVVLQFGVIEPDAADYTVELRRDGALVHREHALRPVNDMVDIDVRANRLGPGEYRARIVARLKQGGEREYDDRPFVLNR